MNRTFREMAETVITAAIIFVVLQGVTQTFKVVGPSMRPTLVDGQHLLVNKIVYQTFDNDTVEDLLPWVEKPADGEPAFLFHGPQRGDVIVFKPPTGEDSDFVKRVIGIPGDEIDIEDGMVFVNDEAVEDGRTTRPRGSTDFPLTVPDGGFFVLGDNRGSSNDSRAWGFVNAEDIVGRVLARYWPLSDFKIF